MLCRLLAPCHAKKSIRFIMYRYFWVETLGFTCHPVTAKHGDISSQVVSRYRDTFPVRRHISRTLQMRRCLLLTLALAACVSASAGTPAAFTHDRAYWRAVIAKQYQVPANMDAASLATELASRVYAPIWLHSPRASRRFP